MEVDEQLQGERERLKQRGLPEEVTDKILEFDDDMSLQGLSLGRRYAYILRLRRIASLIPQKFLDPSVKDIKSVMKTISETKVKWGGNRKEKDDQKKDSNNSEGHLPTENGKQAYLVALKKFYKWHLGGGIDYPVCVKWIKIGNVHPSRQVAPEDLLSQKEMSKLLQACENARDRAIFSTLYDSGVRIGEMLNMKISDVKFDVHGAVLRVPEGKTGFRQVVIVGNSIPYLRAWLNEHPDKDNDKAWLFTSQKEDIRGRKLTHYNIYNMMGEVSRRAELKRRIYPHLFRHTRATILASKVVEAPLESQMGWVHGSKQTRTYVHLSLRDQQNVIWKAYGIEVQEDEKDREELPTECPRCKQKNPSNSQFCNTCGMPLDIKARLLLDKKREEAESALLSSSVVDENSKRYLKAIDPNYEDKFMDVLLNDIANDPQKREKYIRELMARLSVIPEKK